MLFNGDRDCGDNAQDCAIPDVVAQHRFLHVVIHDIPRSYDWAVTEATACDGSATVLVQGGVVNADGFMESVVDLQAAAPGLLQSANCFVFRGREGYPETFYAAYFDDNPNPDADTVLPDYRSLDGRPDMPDLDVTYIHRSPTYPYDAPKNQPAAGDPVIWNATVRNAGSVTAVPFSYQWKLNDHVVGTGRVSVSMQAGQSVQIPLSLPWSSAPQNLTFSVDPGAPDGSAVNNSLSVRTNAISLGIWVEQSAYAYFAQNQWTYCRHLSCTGSNSFEDWLQRQISHWNALFASSTYPGLAPTGVADRVRVDEVNVEPDGSLPLHGGIPTNTPDLNDHSVDLEWGIPAQGIADEFRLHRDASFDVDWSLMHELGHARSLADLYRFDVPLRDDQSIRVTALDGAPAFDQSDPTNQKDKLQPYRLPDGEQFLYRNQEQDLMSCTCTPTYSAYTVLVLNRIRGRRAICGNVNEPCNLGDWFIDVPPRSSLHLLDANGHSVAAGSKVRLFFDTGTSYSGHVFSDSLSQTLVLHDGSAMLPPDPFSTGGSHYLAGHNLLLVEVQSGALDTFCFLEPVPFNMAYWQGYRRPAQIANFDLHVGNSSGNSCQISGPPPLLNEPFGASPQTSSARLITDSATKSRTRREVIVNLRDDQAAGIPLYGRMVEVRNANGKSVGVRRTTLKGSASITVPIRARGLKVIDLTDNNLAITLLRSTSRNQGGRSL